MLTTPALRIASALLVALGFVAPAADAQLSMDGKAKAKFKTTGSGQHKAKMQFSTVPSGFAPTCPGTSRLRVVSDSYDSGWVELDCSRWSGQGSFRYSGDGEPAGLEKIVYKPSTDSGKLKLSFRSDSVSIVDAPASFVEAKLVVFNEDTRYCGRFDAFRRNSDGRVQSEKSASECPSFAGEIAFFETLTNVADRVEEAVALLDQATTEIANEGRASWLLGMSRLLRIGRSIDYAAPTQTLIDDAAAARAALDVAVPLLADDNRIPGFRGAATYLAGFLAGDDDLAQTGVDQLRAAVAENLIFNSFSFVGTVAIAVAPDDPLFEESIGYLDAGASSGCSPFTEPTICGNEGRAAHNIEGTGLLFGDLYAKNGDADEADNWYAIGALWDDGPGGNDWIARDVLDDRRANLAARVALYQDSDPTNDPSIIGTGAYNCIYCHQQ